MLLGVVFVVTSSVTPAQVYRRAQIPVLIPSVLHSEVTGRVYESVDVAQRGKYSVSFGLAPNCGGATACEVGTVTGGISPDFHSVGYDARWDTWNKPQTVQLRDGTNATFVLFGCGASCSDSLLAFRRHGVWYALFLKAASKAEMIRSANSMLPEAK